jgi:biopolymer transport protein ExbD
MADINTTAASHKSRGLLPRMKKQHTHTDLTPMVDLGFLLITFFMFATNLRIPKSMKLRLPADTGLPGTPVNKDMLLTIMVDSNNVVYTYEANNEAASFKKHTGDMAGTVRTTIQQKNKAVKDLFAGDPLPKKTVVNLKFAAQCNYGTVMALLDEMKINNVGWYTFGQLKDKDRNLITAYTNMTN